MSRHHLHLAAIAACAAAYVCAAAPAPAEASAGKPAAAEEPLKVPALGPLFFTPAERDELDRIRVGINDSDDPAHAMRTMQLDGVIQKNGGTPMLWINGQRYMGRMIAGATLDNALLDASTIVVHLPPPDARDMALHVGQTLDPAGGNLREVYQRPPQELNQLLQLLARRGEAAPSKPDKAGAATPAAANSGQPARP